MKYDNLEEYKKVKSIIMDKIGVYNDNQLAKYFKYTSNSAINEWNKKLTIPEKILRKYYENTNISKNSTNILKPTTDQITINVYKDIYASAGYGTKNSELVPTKMTFDKNFLKEIFNITDCKNLDIIRVIGDSMLPTIKDGEYIFVQKDTPVKNGDTIIANIEDELYIKRYYKIPYEKWIKLESDNPEYPCINIDTSEKLNTLKIIGVVKSKVKLY